ncbi:MAG TPA: endonuclease/exonuclease/phosphatase family protein [Noviherbaspirillum sp.]|uniref:endonuclease/exonuclease/phosphatase family protein n=1 Tax=Noviherbaspirillum sp. TaxID=1926288 RepID=UPI002D42C6A5|nr:endonuclease/exonuclease/phosphatase family protein [Noviherbaspirillum sp.]HYD93734.1 endonuclease/exonuclease/phosphatase family protein [Noviherbaspirillum sp.]
MKLRIATYNIHKGVSSLRSMPRIHALKQALASMEADILFLQEVQGRHDKYATRHASLWPEQAQHQFLAGESHQAVYGMNAIYDHGHHGNALLSRFPVVSASNRDVSDHAFESRGILHCVVQTPAGDVHCYVVHLGLFARSRRRQTEALIEAVTTSSPPDAPVIIAGDFNDWTNQLSDSLRAELGVTEVFDENLPSRGFGAYLRTLAGRGPKLKPARTFPAALPWLRLDRIYVRGFEVETAQVLHGPLWARLSDHAPIVASLSMNAMALAEAM